MATTRTGQDISVIVPTCNREAMLHQTLRAIAEQSECPTEVIVVNNGSQSMAAESLVGANVRVLEIMPFAGVAQARNFGACVARGSYLAFCDDDDLWNPQYLACVAEALSEGAVCVLSRIDALDAGRIEAHKNPHDRLTMANLLVMNPGVTGSNIVLSKAAFFSVGGYDPRLPSSEDKSLVIELMLRGIAPVTLPDNQVLRRMHGGARLTDAAGMIEGITEFVKKYKRLMNVRQRLYNEGKIQLYRHKIRMARFRYNRADEPE